MSSISLYSSNNSSIIKKWIEALDKSLKKIGNYMFLVSKEITGCLSIIYIKEIIKQKIKELSDDSYSFYNLASNSTSGIKFMINDTSFCFVNCHLD